MDGVFILRPVGFSLSPGCTASRRGGVCGTLALLAATIFVLLMLSGAARSARALSVQDVRCVCHGKTGNQKLVVETAQGSRCGNRKLSKKGQGRYPLHTKFSRSANGSHILITWNLKYIPRKKRSKLTEFHLLFTKTPKTRRGVNTTERKACFAVTGLHKACRKKITCSASYRKKRPRRLFLQLMYSMVRKRRHRRTFRHGDRKFHVLETSLKRKKRASKSNGQKKKRRRGPKSCEDWHPSIALVEGPSEVTVNYRPVNSRAAEIEIALHNEGSTLQLRKANISADVSSYTFTNVKPGSYEVALHSHGPGCEKTHYIWSKAITLQDAVRPRKKSRHKNGITSCTEWLPSIDVDATVDGEVKVKYSPQNPWASQIEFALHNGNGHLQVNRTFQDKAVTSYTFRNLKPGNYTIALRALGEECVGVPYIWSDPVTVEDKIEVPECSFWQPKVKANVTDKHGGWVLINVDFDTPRNFNAEKIEVALEQNKSMIEWKYIGVKETNTVFNISVNNDYILQALVRPLGCKDCKDYRLHGDPCYLSYATSEPVPIRKNDAFVRDEPSMKNGNTPVSTAFYPYTAGSKLNNDSNVNHPRRRFYTKHASRQRSFAHHCRKHCTVCCSFCGHRDMFL